MASHTTLTGGIRLTLGKRGIVFTRHPNRFNRCVGGKLIGQRGGGRAGVRNRFTSAAKSC